MADTITSMRYAHEGSKIGIGSTVMVGALNDTGEPVKTTPEGAQASRFMEDQGDERLAADPVEFTLTVPKVKYAWLIELFDRVFPTASDGDATEFSAYTSIKMHATPASSAFNITHDFGVDCILYTNCRVNEWTLKWSGEGHVEMSLSGFAESRTRGQDSLGAVTSSPRAVMPDTYVKVGSAEWKPKGGEIKCNQNIQAERLNSTAYQAFGADVCELTASLDVFTNTVTWAEFVKNITTDTLTLIFRAQYTSGETTIGAGVEIPVMDVTGPLPEAAQSGRLEGTLNLRAWRDNDADDELIYGYKKAS